MLDIVLRTCEHSNVHTDWRVRYVGKSKTDIIKGCVKSLLNSCKKVSEVRLTILDDHSSQETLDWLRSELSGSGIDGTIVSLVGHGYNNSSYEQWKLCRDSDADLVYSIEDDYLHHPDAIKEMIDSFQLFSDRLKRNDIVLFPFDEPSEYSPPNRSDFIVHGSARHWRTGVFTTQVLFCKPQLFRDYWPVFETLALKYNGDYLNPRTEHYEESNTIWKLWTEGTVIRFNPIPSLALHLQFEQQRDPFIDWEEWWREYTK